MCCCPKVIHCCFVPHIVTGYEQDAYFFGCLGILVKPFELMLALLSASVTKCDTFLVRYIIN